MRDSSTSRRTRRLVKTGIAAGAAVAAAGALFAAQAGAAQVTYRTVMIKVNPNIHCVYVIDWDPITGHFWSDQKYKYKALGWSQQNWNNTGIKARVGDKLNIWLSTQCNQSDGYGRQYQVGVPPTGKGHHKAWVDTTELSDKATV